MSLKVDPKFISSSMATDAELAAHVSDKANPHEVTKTQVGLSNVPNVDTTNPSNITQDSTHRFVTDAEKTLWNNNSSAVQSVAGKTGIIVLDKSDVSLVNVDNTSDANKPISTATQTALDSKQATITAGTTSQYYRGDKTWQTLDKSAVSLNNVDNTSDVNKPVSTATQTALNAKQDTITGSATTITTSNLTASRAIISNASGKIAISTVTDTELSYVSGVTSSIQTQLNAKESANFIPPVQPDDIFRGYLYQQNSTTVSAVNITTPSTQGTATARSVASTNMLTKQVRMAYAVSTPAMDQQCGVRVAQALWAMSGGFKFVTTFAYTDSQYNSGARQFYGLTSATTLLGVNSTITVSSLLNIIGIGSDAGDTALSIYCNDGTGSATKTTLSATDFPANRTAGAASTDIFSLELYNAPASTEVKYKVTNVTTGVQATGTLTTDLPSTSTMLSFQAIRTSGSTSNACSIDLTKIGCYNLV